MLKANYHFGNLTKARFPMDRAKLWLERLYKYIEDHKDDPDRRRVCSWWLRLEYNNEASTAQINYWLNKSVKEGILQKETSYYCTRYWVVGHSVEKGADT